MGWPGAMTISSTDNKAIFPGDGANTVFNFTFPASPLPAADFVLTYVDAAGNETTVNPALYTLTLTAALTGAIWGLGGSVTYPLSGAPIALGITLVLERLLPLKQT